MASYHADDAGLANAIMVLDAEGVELARHHLGGPMLLESEFRMGMQIAPDRREFGQVVAQRFDRIHRRVSMASWPRPGARSGAADRRHSTADQRTDLSARIPAR